MDRPIATVNEQAALSRSSCTSIVREAGDSCAELVYRRGRTVTQAATGARGHIDSIASGIVRFFERFPLWPAPRIGPIAVSPFPRSNFGS